jgi:uncharacterized protein (TIGR02266 family)
MRGTNSALRVRRTRKPKSRTLKSSRAPADLPGVAISRTGAEQQQNPAERRTAPRIELEVEVGLETEHNFYTGLTQDISSGGIFVATGLSYRVGEKMTVRFTLPGRKEPIVAESEVRWIRDSRYTKTDAPDGVGLRFISLPPADQAAIVSFLESRDSLFYDDE